MKKLFLIPFILLGLSSCQKEEVIEPNEVIYRTISVSNGEIYVIQNSDTLGPYLNISLEKGSLVNIKPFGCATFYYNNEITGVQGFIGGTEYCTADIIVIGLGSYQVSKYYNDLYKEWIVP